MQLNIFNFVPNYTETDTLKQKQLEKTKWEATSFRCQPTLQSYHILWNNIR